MNKRDLTEKINELDLNDRHKAIIEIITRFPNYHKDTDLMNLLAAAYINFGDYDGAAGVLRTSGISGQYNSDWFYLSGLCAYYKNDKQAAFDFLEIGRAHV